MISRELKNWVREKLFLHVPVNIAVIDPEFRVVEANDAFEKTFGEWENRRCFEVYKGFTRPCPECRAAKTFSDGAARINQEIGIDRSGNPIRYLVHLFPLVRRSDGAIPYVIEMSTDTTLLSELQERYHVLFDKTPCYIAIIDREFRVVQANRRFRDTFGDPSGRFCYQMYKHRDEKCGNCPAELVFTTAHEQSASQVGLDKDGVQTHYIVNATPLTRTPIGEVETVMEISFDVTRTRLLESQLKQIEEEKIAAERLAAVGQTVSGLAHGIKNIVTGLEGGLYVLRTGFKKSDVEKIRKGLEMLDGNIARISHFVKEFLNFARGKKPEVRMTNPNAIAREVHALYHEAGKNEEIEVALEMNEDIADAPLDPDGIHACLANLVSNALDACQMSDRKKRLVTIRTLERDGTIIYEVSDNGIGMDAEVKKKVFTSFFSTKGSHQGTGIGLLITRKIVQEHGGAVSIDSTRGKGSTFRLELPRSRLPKPEKEEAANRIGCREQGAGCEKQ
ncbi:MAG: ATP-binding protein [bacterium]